MVLQIEARNQHFLSVPFVNVVQVRYVTEYDVRSCYLSRGTLDTSDVHQLARAFVSVPVAVCMRTIRTRAWEGPQDDLGAAGVAELVHVDGACASISKLRWEISLGGGKILFSHALLAVSNRQELQLRVAGFPSFFGLKRSTALFQLLL